MAETHGNPNMTINDHLALLGVIDPASKAAGTYTTGWIAASDFVRFEALLQVGAMTATGTIDAKLEQATSSGGAGAKDITGKLITQMLAAADSNKQVRIELRNDELDANNNFTHFRLSVTTATAASILGAQILGMFPRYGYAGNKSIAALKEVVNV